MNPKSRNGRKYKPLTKKEKEHIIQSRKQGIQNKDIKKVINKPLSTIQSCYSSERKDCLKDYINVLSFYCLQNYQEQKQTQNLDSEKQITKQINKIAKDAIQQKKFKDLLPFNKQETQKNNTVRRRKRVVQQCLYYIQIDRPSQYFQLTLDDIEEIIKLSQIKWKNQKIAKHLNKTLNIVQRVVENYNKENDRTIWQDKILEKINVFYSDLNKTFYTQQEQYQRLQDQQNEQISECQSFVQQFNDKTVQNQFDANDDEFGFPDSNAYLGVYFFKKTINSEISQEKIEELSFFPEYIPISRRSDESEWLF